MESVIDLSVLSSFGNPEKYVRYGTAGFRDRAAIMRPVIARSSLVASLLSLACNGIVGIVITASHNPVEDNGVKIVDNCGDMLRESWERYAEQLINCDTLAIQDLLSQSPVKLSEHGLRRASVIIGWDSRPESQEFSQISSRVISSLGGVAFDAGMMTTPLLHFIVGSINKLSHNTNDNEREIDDSIVQKIISCYYSQASDAFNELLLVSGEYLRKSVVCDVSHGVGEIYLSSMSTLTQHVSVVAINRMNDGELNHECGAEFVQKQSRLPSGLALESWDNDNVYCSFDGDADRFIAYCHLDGLFKLIDGDRILCLLATFVHHQLSLLSSPYSLHAIQTAYANGSSSRYLRELCGIDCVHVTKTGVKHLVKKAKEFHVSVYFEANGHGSIYFSDEIMSYLTSHRDQAPANIIHLSRIMNPYIGDAGSVMLAYAAIVHVNRYSDRDIIDLYHDLVSKQTKMKVADLTLFECNSAETRLIRPLRLQNRIDDIVHMEGCASVRCFVRPSGTEPIVRIYAEGNASDQVDRVTRLVEDAIRNELASV